ncbi:orotate phosphoribosyltransferase [Nocardia jiangsuensis]|uniref:Orotate phosphoribosyltransferase n=1 Tax=Nocardia jiangsuensis TaxID=1691563 RepID=A0ABV8DP74_9NOCA
MTPPPELITRIRDTALQRGEFILPSGEILDEYFDQYALAASPVLLAEVAAALAELVPAETDVLAGVALGGIALAVAVSAATGVPTAFVRADPKPHGLRRQVEGPVATGARVVVIDDVVRTGGQVRHAVAALHGAGARVPRAICVLDRHLGGRDMLRATGVELRALLDPATLMQLPRGAGVADARG